MKRSRSEKSKVKVIESAAVSELKARINALEGVVDALRGKILPQEVKHQTSGGVAYDLTTAKTGFLPNTQDGWLLVMMSGTKTSLPSGLSVSITGQSGGRDKGVVSEGVYSGAEFDVKSGYVANTFERTSNLKVVFKRTMSSIVIGGTKYEHELTLTFSAGRVEKVIGPFPATTDVNNPVPSGSHDIEIADYPHDLGSSYGAYATVWFRIGHSGDRYIHPGLISAGCITCAPKNWVEIYRALNVGRLGDARSVGKLEVT